MNAQKVLLIKRPAKLGGKRIYYWTLRWKDSSGKDRYEGLGRVGRISASEAKTAQRRKMLDLTTGKAQRKRTTKMPLSEFIEFHELHFSQGKQPTTTIEWRTAGNHAVKALGDKAIDAITWKDASEIRSYIKSKGKSAATIRKTLAGLKSMLARAVKCDLVYKNPFTDVQLGPPPQRPKRIYTQLELNTMIEVAIDLWWKAAITLGHTSGLRRGEILHLRWTDFDAGAGTIRVEEHHEGRHIADGVDVPLLAWKPKTKRSARTVAIPPQTVSMLLRKQMRSDGGPYIFLSINRLQAIDAKAKAGKLKPDFDLVNNFTREFNAIQTAAKKHIKKHHQINNWPHGCFHDLRKTFATRAASNGVPMHELQAHLGHSSITTTAEYYTAIEQSAADRLRAVFTEVA